jgi:FKBP-type peptidyl-prolyl cis-trans isomerase
VIAGWTEALQLMKPGAKWRVYIPSQLAYGTRGAGRVIGPNAALIFDIELLKVKPSLESSSNSNMPDEEAG